MLSEEISANLLPLHMIHTDQLHDVLAFFDEELLALLSLVEGELGWVAFDAVHLHEAGVLGAVDGADGDTHMFEI